MCRGSAYGLSDGGRNGADVVGADRQSALASHFPGHLEGIGKNMVFYYTPREKKLAFCKKNVCIWGKMGYNKMV